jgi:hypothetical protein
VYRGVSIEERSIEERWIEERYDLKVEETFCTSGG